MLNKFLVMYKDFGISGSKSFVKHLSISVFCEVSGSLDTVIVSMIVMPVDSPMLVRDRVKSLIEPMSPGGESVFPRVETVQGPSSSW